MMSVVARFTVLMTILYWVVTPYSGIVNPRRGLGRRGAGICSFKGHMRTHGLGRGFKG